MTPDERLKYYRRFTDSRNKYAEVILDKYRAKISDALRPAFVLMAHAYLSGNNKHTQHLLSYQMQHTAIQVAHLFMQMRRNVYILSTTSEAEVLSRITNKKDQVVKLPKIHEVINRPLAAGGTVQGRVLHYLKNITRKLQAVSDLAELKGEKPDAIDVQACFPRLKGFRRKTELHRLSEADRTRKPNVTTDSVSDAEWDDIVGDYQDEFLATNRGPEGISSDSDIYASHLATGGRTAATYSDTTYDWELENDLTHDFVQTLRDGQNDAANENGIVDMLWVAILDNKTDECCVWRDGLTSTEIQTALENEHSDDDCRAIVVPAHFNCRCSMEPSTEDLPDAPESNKGDFDDWLNS